MVIKMKNRLWCLTGVILLILDQLTKYLAAKYLNTPYVIWDGVLELRYYENTGMAFSMMEGLTVFLIMSTVLAMAVIAWIFTVFYKNSKWEMLTHILILILTGGVGNLIDRISHRYVIDFIYIKLINFPIFNLADTYVTLAMVWLIWLLLFRYEERDIQEIVTEIKDKIPSRKRK